MSGVTRQDAQALARVRAWLAVQPGNNQLEIDILSDLEGRVASGAHDAAIVRVRIKNLGNPKSAVARKPRGLPVHGVLWTETDLNRLRELYDDNVRVVAIAEQLGRTPDAVSFKVGQLGLTRQKPTPFLGSPLGVWDDASVRGPRETPLQAARRVIQQRKWREAQARREA